jgi:general secretion pathway protein G
VSFTARRRRGGRGARPGFTLIELLVVIVIIATLAAVVGPSLFGNVDAARQSAAKSQLHTFVLALDSYRLDNGAYPTTEQGLDALWAAPLPSGDVVPLNWRGPYLRQPAPRDPWNRSYVYRSPGVSNPTAFDLYSLGRDGKIGGTGDDADITSWNGPVQESGGQD